MFLDCVQNLLVDFCQLIEVVLKKDDFLSLSLDTHIAIVLFLNSTSLNLNS